MGRQKGVLQFQGSIGAAILSAPISLPAVIVSIGGYFAVAGSVIGAVSQLTTKSEL